MSAREFVSITEAARRLEYTRKALADLLRREGIPTRREGTARLVDWERVAELVAVRTASVSLASLAASLGVTRQRLTRRLRRAGMLREVVHGASASIPREDAEHFARWWRRHASRRAA